MADRILAPDKLFHYLCSRPKPVTETDLLREFYPESRKALTKGMSMELFRYHFLLYHSLYKLAEELEKSASDYFLFVKTINVYFLKKPDRGYCRYFNEKGPAFCGNKTEVNGEYCTFHRDLSDSRKQAGTVGDAGMREYYLDFRNMHTMDEQKLKMWEKGIFTYAASHEEVERSLDILGLSPDFSLQRLKNRYRYLCKQHHPDTESGNDTTRRDFGTIQHAYQLLLELRQGEND